jgi:uncharacterized protein CbrC (UPF0167 family)
LLAASAAHIPEARRAFGAAAAAVMPNAAPLHRVRAGMLAVGALEGTQSMPTRQWSDMDAVIRRRVVDLSQEMVPSDPGVYAWYREGKRKYVGQAASLRARLWRNHLGQSLSLSSSALRRNVAQRLGFGTTAALKRREVILTAEQLAQVRAWLLSCELAWLTCGNAADAIALEIRLRKESLPCLNQR